MGWLGSLGSAIESRASSVERGVSGYFGGTPLKFTIPAPQIPGAGFFGSVGSYFSSAFHKFETVGAGTGGGLESFFSRFGTTVKSDLIDRPLALLEGTASAGGRVAGSAFRGLLTGGGLPTMLLILAVVIVIGFFVFRR